MLIIPKDPKLKPFTYEAAFYDTVSKRTIEGDDMTPEERTEARKQIILNMANALIRPYGAVARIVEYKEN